VLSTSVSLTDVVNHLGACGVAVIEGPVNEPGHGPDSFDYFRDPDMNLIGVQIVFMPNTCFERGARQQAWPASPRPSS